MIWKYWQMPDAILRFSDDWGQQENFIRSFNRGGKRWCKYNGHLLLLRDDGSVGGFNTRWTWEKI